jgi:hypothetical protein
MKSPPEARAVQLLDAVRRKLKELPLHEVASEAVLAEITGNLDEAQRLLSDMPDRKRIRKLLAETWVEVVGALLREIGRSLNWFSSPLWRRWIRWVNSDKQFVHLEPRML